MSFTIAPPKQQDGFFQRATKEIIFLGIVVGLTYALFAMMVMEWGGFLTIGSKALDPIMRKVGIFSPFLLWAIYVVLHRGWQKMFASFMALVICTGGLVYLLGTSMPNSLAGSIMQVLHKHYRF